MKCWFFSDLNINHLKRSKFLVLKFNMSFFKTLTYVDPRPILSGEKKIFRMARKLLAMTANKVDKNQNAENLHFMMNIDRGKLLAHNKGKWVIPTYYGCCSLTTMRRKVNRSYNWYLKFLNKTSAGFIGSKKFETTHDEIMGCGTDGLHRQIKLSAWLIKK